MNNQVLMNFIKEAWNKRYKWLRIHESEYKYHYINKAELPGDDDQ